MENFLKFRLLAYLESCQTSMMLLFCGDRGLLLAVFFFTETLNHTRFSDFWMRLGNLFDILMVTMDAINCSI